MTAGSDMASDPIPLTAEERALAQRLARLGPHAEPSPALDARVLAAAHAAAGSGVRHRQRWPLALGVAASLALAVGVAWRLRPLPEPAPAYRSQTVSASKTLPAPVAAAGAAEDEQAAAARSAAAPMTLPATPPAVARDTQTQSPPGSQPDAFPSAVRQPPPTPGPPEEAPIVFDAPAPTTPPEAATSSAVAGAMAPSRNAQAGTPAAEASEMPQRASQTRERNAGIPVDADIPADAMAEEDVPPATADAPEVRDAWLQRIRELAAAGKLDDARASLREFSRRWPDYPLPDDLRALGR